MAGEHCDYSTREILISTLLQMQTFKNVMLHKALAVWSSYQLLAQQVTSLNGTTQYHAKSTHNSTAATQNAT